MKNIDLIENQAAINNNRNCPKTMLGKKFTNDLPAIVASGALNGSMADFVEMPCKSIEERSRLYFDWQKSRKRWGVWPFSNSIFRAPGSELSVANASGEKRTGLNFASQDYLGLSADKRVRDAVIDAVREFSPHSASAPVLQGNTVLSLRLEAVLAEYLRMEHVLLFPTGWAAGFGAIVGMMRKNDHVVLDQYAHNCLALGASTATPNVHRVRHLSTAGLVKRLRHIRAADAENAILVVTEGIFSMDADSPDITTLQAACREYEATLLVDIAHDLGSCGPGGTGVLGLQDMLGKVDLVVGSFSKVFASNGGFVATHSAAVKEYLRPYSSTHTFSNAISPSQCAGVLSALEIVRSSEGDELRQQIINVVNCLRTKLQSYGIKCLGQPGPLVPVPIGAEKVGRIAAALCFEAGVFANLVEYPAVSVGASRFRMQAMSSHTIVQAEQAAEIIGEAYRFANQLFAGSRI